MGLYLEETLDGTKLTWLEANGNEVVGATSFSPNVTEHGGVPCILVAYTRNPFEAAALMFEQREVTRYVQGRPDARWFRIPLDRIPPSLAKWIKPVRK